MNEVDIRAACAPKSDQINADDLIGTTKTITVAAVTAGNKEQPINIEWAGGTGKPFRPCKSMLRVLISAWGDKGSDWVGRSMTLYNDPTVVYAGVEVGGIRISHLSHIEAVLMLSLSASRGKRKPYRVDPIKVDAKVEGIRKLIEAAMTHEALADLGKGEAMAALSDAQKARAREAYKARWDAIQEKAA